MLFQLNRERMNVLKKKPFILERQLQKIVEINLKLLFNLEFLDTEFKIGDFRFDTLAFDKENNNFVIIEYKRGKNESLVDQGYAYLHTVLDRKAELVLLYNDKMGKSNNIRDFEWELTRIYFISPEFTSYQKKATGYQKMPFKLYEINRYENDMIIMEEINDNKLKEKPLFLSNNEEIKTVDKQIKVYTEEEHLSKLPSKMKDLYNLLKEKILECGDVIIEPKKVYIAYKVNGNNFCDIELYQSYIKVMINIKKSMLYDPLHKAKEVSDIGHHGNGDYSFNLYGLEDLDYLIMLVKQSYNNYI